MDDILRYAPLFAALLIFAAGVQLNRMEKRLNRIVDLLWHVREIRDGATDEVKTDKLIEQDARARP